MPQTYSTDVYKRQMTEKYFDMVYRLAFSRTKDSDHADDVCQDVFYKFLKTDKEFETEEHLKAWLIRVTINQSKSIFTNSWFKKTVPLSEKEDELIFTTPEKNDLYHVIKKLPQKYATVIHLFYYEDLPVAKIAQILDMKETTVKSHLHRARNMLKELLGGRYDYEF